MHVLITGEFQFISSFYSGFYDFTVMMVLKVSFVPKYEPSRQIIKSLAKLKYYILNPHLDILIPVNKMDSQ